MTFKYRAGSWSPGSKHAAPGNLILGCVQVGAHLNIISDASSNFMLTNADGLFASPAVRETSTNLALADGMNSGEAYYTNKPFVISGQILCDAVRDLDAAEDYLRSQCLLTGTGARLLPVYYRRPGWGAGRYVMARPDGSVSVMDADGDDAGTYWKQFTIPMKAPQPESYSITRYNRKLTSKVAADLNRGNWPAPWTAEFPAGTHNPTIVVGGKRITINMTVPGGRRLILDSATRGAKLDNGDSVWGVLSGSFADLSPRGRAYVGAGQRATFTYRDCWM